MIEVIPVLDLMGSLAVSGKSGKREEYKPLESIFSASPDPIEIALSLKRAGARRIYIADLDAITGQGSNIQLIQEINHIIPVMLDFGVQDFKSFKFGLNIAWQVIVATETLKDINELKKIFKVFPKSRIVVSIDTKNGQLYSKNLNMTLEEFKDILLQLDPGEVILLDLTRVGTQKGINKKLIKKFIKFDIIPGGGIKLQDIPLLSSIGIKKILAGTALHQGKIPLHIR
ncbi:HisA/HisF family protein [Methanothermobacter tenebrarum]|uniref:HisA/HisF family protein n=1 Tax=Methanothermobacter tenebrarum TaxID=680118 RepID=A0A328PB58_9EURY|nr:HisA/HisF family protein [Methanothermobacter tenebrarum]MBC7100370.1 HisA/HisF family protein [Methanobacteriales archaeon]MBC7117901.1 HisA/HisF family protein [Methanobacteriaceae archaeon]NPV64371.1 HisA/HisF family protein [Methanobacteriaceae archaeon]RAO78850.1 HisA/HisF family protein [Methanothermobacter tenebrarum]